MKIAVNTRLLIKSQMEGIARFNYEILKRIVRDHPGDEFYFFFDRPYSDDFIFGDNVSAKVLMPPTRHPLLTAFWLEVQLKRALKKLKPDIFFSGDSYMPLNSGVKTLIVSHDLAYLHFPDHQRFFDRNYYRLFFEKFHNAADRIIAVSNFTKKDIIEKYNIPPGKIEVVYNAANGHFYPVDESTKQKTRDKISNGKPYFAYLGSIHPRKNLTTLIEGFNIFKRDDDKDYHLVIIGRPAWKTKSFYEALNNSPYKEYIVTRQMPREELPEYIASADAMFYISLFEGFGIPILEGFEAGVPVVTSNVSSMPEVAGDAALLVDPRDASTVARAMHNLAADKDLRSQLVAKGFERLKNFSWEASAAKVYNAMKSLAAS